MATASHALTGKGRVAETTRLRVQEVAERLGYEPDPAARRLAGGRSNLIAVVFSLPQTLPVNVTDVDYFSQAIRAATERALEDDYALVVGPPTAQTKIWQRIPLDGVVVFDPVAGDPILADFRARTIPLVLSGRDPDGGDDYCVDNDHVAGTRSVLDHLAERGGRRVALLAADLGDAFTDDCLANVRGLVRGAPGRADRAGRPDGGAQGSRRGRPAPAPLTGTATRSTRPSKRSA